MIPIGNGIAKDHRSAQRPVEAPTRDDIHRLLEDAYVFGARIEDECSRHARVGAVPSAIDHVRLPGEVEADADPACGAVVLWVTDASGGEGGETAVTHVRLLAGSDLVGSAQSKDVQVTSVLMKPSLIARLAADAPVGYPAPPVHFTSLYPVDAAAAELWKASVRHVKNIALADDALATPLVLGKAGSLLAAVALAAFPHTVTADPTSNDHCDQIPELLRRAIEFMDANAGNDIAMADVADAVHVTPRAVQYMFRRHLDTTPLQYLRRMRLSYAHVELLAADRMHETVTAIATRWGFMHTGRFAVLYRETYGQSPHATLRS